MPKLRNMIGETGEIEIEIPDDEPLRVRYRRGAITPRLQARLGELQRAAGPDAMPGAEAVAALCEMYAAAIVEWNLTDDDGTPIGTDADSLQDVDFGTLNMVVTAIGQETTADPTSGGGSNNGSSPAESSGPRLITTAS
jgi:hypothetical protein